MAMRAYHGGWLPGDPELCLSEEEVRHLTGVRRVRVGECVDVLNGKGAIAECVVANVSKRSASLEIKAVRQLERPPFDIHLLVALPKGKTFPGVLAKAVELGASRIIPLLSDHAEVPEGRVVAKQDRWLAILIEAIKQSGNPWLPDLTAPMSLAAAWQQLGGGPAICAALQPDARPLAAVLRDGLPPSQPISLWIGPEGDFSAREYAWMRASGFTFASLGPWVLRVETAVTVAIGALALYAAVSPLDEAGPSK